ncbi:MAG: choice-of-anchor D domain-containing protein [Ignavibacteriae bacterium]|nr:choice-of-anchor D domain-containing protein [Ignavibacteriota bacterium]
MKYSYNAGYWIVLTVLVGVACSCSDAPLADDNQPRVQIVVSSLELNYGLVPTNETSEQSIEITNSFSFGRTLSGTINISGNGFSIIKGGEPFNLAPGESRAVVVRFKPQSLSSYTGSLTISHNGLNVSNPIVITLKGGEEKTGPSAILVDPSSLDFGSTQVGQSPTKIVTITNPPNSLLDLIGTITVAGTGFSVVSGDGQYDLAPGRSRSVTIKFAPGLVGSFSGSITIVHNASDTVSPFTVTLKGTGATRVVTKISVTPTSVDFGTVLLGQLVQRDLTISNPIGSTEALNLTVSLASGSTGYTLSGGGSFSLIPGETRTVTVTFSASQKGLYTGSLKITHNATNVSSPLVVALRGEKTSSIVLSVSPASINFGTILVGDHSEQGVTIGNALNSTGKLIGSFDIIGSGFSIVSGSGAYDLAPGQSITLTVRFLPTTNSSYSGSVRVFNNGTSVSNPIFISLSGSGQWKTSISVSTTLFDFGTVVVGQSAEQSLTFTNSSSSIQTISGTVIFGITSNGFSFTQGGGSYSLPPGQTRTVKVRFSPQSSGSHGGELQIWHSAQNFSNPVRIPMQAYGQLRAVTLSASPAFISFGGVRTGQTLDRTITISNSSASTGVLTGSIGMNGSGFSIVSGMGNYSLNPGQSTVVTVRFSPINKISYSASLQIVHNATNIFSPATVPLSGTGQ